MLKPLLFTPLRLVVTPGAAKKEIMEKIIYDGTVYARIEGVGLVKLAPKKMRVHQAINARSHQHGLMTRYVRRVGYYNPFLNEVEYSIIPETMRCFISLCRVPEEIMEAPNSARMMRPDCF